MWDVFEEGVAAAVASFSERDAAAEYARRLAARRGGDVRLDDGARRGVP